MDEADRICDMGFEIDLNLILDSMPATSLKPEDSAAVAYDTTEYRVTSLYSATMPIAVERIARKYLRKPATITIGDTGEAAQTVEQRVEFIASDEKKKTRMIDILRNGGFTAPIVSQAGHSQTSLTDFRSSLSIKSVLRMWWYAWFKVQAGQRQPSTPTKLKHNGKPLCSHFGMAMYKLSWRLTWLGEVWMSLTFVSRLFHMSFPHRLRYIRFSSEAFSRSRADSHSTCVELANG